ncbi:DUF302 domain-containing protein [Flavobacteriaceae bacterium AU392]|nr:DUF302 domain-containing protein [Flavobacteriaceae bacterium]RKM82642.1 DUF302 domain-containing protein [Flavobacteriaceae bacterium AU392]
MKQSHAILFFSLLIFACKPSNKTTNTNINNMSITLTKETPVEVLATELISKIETKGFKVVADVNHSEAAAKVGMQLRPTRTLIFGNPLGGTKLMQQDQFIGLDLPLKILIWENEDGNSNLSYFDGSTLTCRYGITEPEMVINKINIALASFTENTDVTGKTTSNIKNELISKKSSYNIDTTFTRLKDIVSSKGLIIMAEVPHDKAAASVDLKLQPTRTLIFGNPKIGTLLMQSNQKIGLDLPLKILVHETDNGEVFVSYYNATFLANRYQITDKDEVVNKVNGALNGITDAVISE